MPVILQLVGELAPDESARTRDEDAQWLAGGGTGSAALARWHVFYWHVFYWHVFYWHYARLASSVIGMPANARETGQVSLASAAIRSKSCSLMPATFALTSR